MSTTQRSHAPENYLDRLSAILRPIFSLLEAGIQHASLRHEEAKARKVDPWYFSHTVRWYTWLGLDELRRSGTIKFLLAEKPMSGLEVVYDGLALKILRPGDDGESIPDAKNEQQKLFFAQNVATIFDGNDFFSVNSLVLIWEYDLSSRSLTATLRCPRPDGSELWSIPIPHPATDIEAAPPPQPPDDFNFEPAESEGDEKKASEGDMDDRRKT